MPIRLQKAYFAMVQYHIPKLFYRNRFLAIVYYTLFSGAFRREMKGVLAGKIRHLDQTHQDQSNLFLLVRNTHRLEKGLIMRPRKSVFALDFIEETVASLKVVMAAPMPDQDQQIHWFLDVMTSYFEAVDLTHPIIAKEKATFDAILDSSNRARTIAKVRVPYIRFKESASDVRYDDFLKLIQQRKSVRWFLDKPVPRDLIDKAMLAAGLAPSACNRQPYEFFIFDQKELVAKLSDIPMGTRGFSHNFPVFIVIVGNLDAYFDERDRHVIYVDASLASMTFMLALETLGLSSCPINWPDIESRERRMEKSLKLGPHQRPIMCMAVGYPDPDGMVAYSEKRPLDDVRTYGN